MPTYFRAEIEESESELLFWIVVEANIFWQRYGLSRSGSKFWRGMEHWKRRPIHIHSKHQQLQSHKASKKKRLERQKLTKM